MHSWMYEFKEALGKDDQPDVTVPQSDTWFFDAQYTWNERWVGGSKEHYRVIGPNGDSLTPIAKTCSNAKGVDNRANALLIAAAPEMRSALSDLVDALMVTGLEAELDRLSPELLARACAAIAKSRGKP